METLWAASIIGYTAAYPIMHVGLRMLAPHFSELTPAKRVYVISNLLKGSILAALTWSLRYTVIDIALSRPWNPETLQLMVPAYCSLDLVSLLLVPQMMLSTKIHHGLVVLCGGYLTLLPKIYPHSLASCICVYAVCSSTAYAVNGLLAMRHVVPDSGWRMRTAARMTALLYAGTCAINWASQLNEIALAPLRLWPIVPILTGFIYDDLVLLRWLVCYKN